MGVRFNSVVTNTLVGPIPASNAEFVICTTPPITPALDNSIILIIWFYVYNPNTGTTQLQTRLRRGAGVTGTSIGVGTWQQVNLASGSPITVSGFYFDSPGAVSGIQYSLTTSQVTASAAGAMNDLAMLAFSL